MRVDHIVSRLEQQLTLREMIVNSVDNLTKVGYLNITSQRVNTRISALKETWEKFSLVHEAINLCMTQLTTDEKLQLQSHLYFSEHMYSKTYESYLEAVERMTLFLESDLEGKILSNSSSSQNSHLPVYFQHARLPQIDISKFNGSSSSGYPLKIYSALSY